MKHRPETGPVTAEEYVERLKAICLRAAGSGFPRKQRDRHILFRSIVADLDEGATYSEPKLNAVLKKWIADVGESLGTDHVHLRRHLVDEGYLVRDAAGRAYRVEAEGASVRFCSDTRRIDVAALLRDAREELEIRKARRGAVES